ncbi:MAG: CatB-related O-acetyltransferase [Pseudomonadota bacterium]
MVEALRRPQVRPTDPLYPTALVWQSDCALRARRAEAGGRCRVAALLRAGYRIARLRGLITRLCLRFEGGGLFSRTLRDLLRHYHGVDVGRYSYGDVLRPGVLPPGTTVGNYCSVGTSLIVRRRDHPIDRLSQSPLFYNSALGFVRRDTIPSDRDNPLSIGHDVWIGDRVTILSGCRTIGNGAVLAAGAVVTRDVAPYTVVGGVPARKIRSRYDVATMQRLEATRWWDLALVDLLRLAPDLLRPVSEISPLKLDGLGERVEAAEHHLSGVRRA